MNKAPVKLTDPQARVLQALRAGRLECCQLDERFGSHGTNHARSLERAGLASRTSEGYEITDRGRELCPSRRALAGLEKPVEQTSDAVAEAKVQPPAAPEAKVQPPAAPSAAPVADRHRARPNSGRGRALAYVLERGQATAAELAGLIGMETKAIYPLLCKAVEKGEIAIRQVLHPWSGRPINIYERPGLAETDYPFPRPAESDRPAVFDPLPNGGWRIRRGNSRVVLSQAELIRFLGRIEKGDHHAQ